MALWKDMLRLGVAEDGAGDDPYQSEDIRWGAPIFSNKKPVHANEFHAAQAGGREVQHMFEVRPCEYAGQTLAYYEGHAFEIYRTYPKSEDVWELYLSSKGASEHAARQFFR